MQTLPERITDLDEAIARDMKVCMKRPIPVKATQMYGHPTGRKGLTHWMVFMRPNA